MAISAIRWIVVVLCALPVGLAGAAGNVDNAALLYYQAFIRCPELYDTFPSTVIYGVFDSTASAQEVREYVEKHREIIELVEAGSRVDRCDWAIPPLQAGSFEGFVVGRVRTAIFLVGADAHLLTAEGHYRRALERVLTLRQLAAHLADDPNLCFSSPLLSEGNAMHFVGNVLDVMPPNKKELAWLKDQLAIEPPVYRWLSRSLQADFDQVLRHYCNPEVLASYRKGLPPNRTEAYEAKKKVLAALSDQDLLRTIREAYAKFLDTVLDVLRQDLPYERTYERLDSLAKAFNQEAQDKPEVVFQWKSDAERAPNSYNLLTGQRAQLNALRTAVEIYMVKADSGQLPDVLPPDLPEDPYSNRKFDYEKTSEGFVLRCQMKPIGENEIRQFKFTVHDSSNAGRR